MRHMCTTWLIHVYHTFVCWMYIMCAIFVPKTYHIHVAQAMYISVLASWVWGVLDMNGYFRLVCGLTWKETLCLYFDVYQFSHLTF